MVVRRLLLLIIVFITVYSLPLSERNQNEFGYEIARWQGNAKGAVTLSFDDGYLLTYHNVVPLLEEKEKKATFNLITERVGDKYGDFELADWNLWSDVVEDGHEIASHMDSHAHVDEISESVLEEELQSSIEKIKRHTGYKAVSFVYPGGAYDTKSRDIVAQYFISARTSDDGYNSFPPADMHLLNSKTAAYFNLEAMDRWADKAESQGLWLIENYHLVTNEKTPNYAFYILTTDFKQHLDHLMTKNLWIAPQGEVAKYIVERENTRVDVEPVSNRKFNIKLSNTLNSSVFDEPLTLVFNLPKDWHTIMVVQEGKKQLLRPNNGTVYINTALSPGKITIAKLL